MEVPHTRAMAALRALEAASRSPKDDACRERNRVHKGEGRGRFRHIREGGQQKRQPDGAKGKREGGGRKRPVSLLGFLL